jgi:hypothetical protein
MAKTRRTPGQERTGPERVDSKPDSRPGGARFGDEKAPTGGHTSDESGPVSRPRSASSGAEDMYGLDAERVPFEEPTRTDTIKSFGSDEEE